MSGRQPTHWLEKQCNSRGQIWTRKIHLQEEIKGSVVKMTSPPVACVREMERGLTGQRVCLKEDPHTIDGHHCICRQKAFKRIRMRVLAKKTAVRM